MSFEKICQLADRFLEKIAAQHYEEHAPEDRLSKDLAWLEPEDRAQLRGWGTKEEVEGNPPKWVAEPSKWKKAKKAVKKYWHRYDEPYAIIAHIYHGPMKGKVKKSKKP